MATVSPSSMINAISEIIEEDLSGAVPGSLPGMDEFYQRLSTTAMGVTSDGIGRDFQVVHPFREGVAGTVKWVSVGGTAPLAGLTHIINNTAANADAYPGLQEAITPGHFNMTITLARAKGNMFIPLEYAKGDTLPAAITNSLGEIIRGAAENVILSELNQFYHLTSAVSGVNNAIATVGATTEADNRDTLDRATIKIAQGSIRQFHTGMTVEIRDNSTGNLKFPLTTVGSLVIDGVRYIPDTTAVTGDVGGWGEIILQSTQTPTGENLGAMADGDIIVRDSSNNQGFLGPEDWLSSTSTSIFGIDLTVHQQFQSIVSAVSGVLTEQTLNRFFARFFKAYGMRDMPDAIVSSMGVMNAYIESSSGLERFERLGRPAQIAGGFEHGGTAFVFNGARVTWDATAFMPSLSDITAATQTGGRLWAMKTRDQNLMRYVPPRTPATMPGVAPIPNEVEFAFAQTGSPFGIFKARHNTSGDTVNFWEAPFDRWMAIAPKFLPGILLSSLTEST